MTDSELIQTMLTRISERLDEIDRKLLTLTVPKLQSVPKFAKSNGMSDEAVIKMIKSGDLPAVNPNPNSKRPHYRIPSDALLRKTL